MGNSWTELIFADVQQDTPQYLCMDRDGFYLCTVGLRDGCFAEQDMQRVDLGRARIFMAAAFNKAMASLNELNRMRGNSPAL